MKSIKGLSFYNSEGSLIDVEELYAQVQQLKQDSAAKIIIGETASTTSTTSSDIDELAGTETDISLTNADDFKAGDMGISIVTVTDRNNSHGFMVFLALADEPGQPTGTLHVRFITGIYNGKDGTDGVSATIEVGTVTTGAPGTQASVTNSGTENAAVLDMTIPRGADGASGVTDVTAGTPTEQDGYTVTPVTFNFEQGNSKTVNIQAKNGEGAGVQQNAVINRTATKPSPTVNSPDFVENNGDLWVKKTMGYTMEANMLSATLPSVRSSTAAATASNGKIYLFGGSDGSSGIPSDLDEIVEFDPETQQVTKLQATLPTPTYEVSAATAPNGKIYVFCGHGPSAEFDPETRVVTSISGLPSSPQSCAATAPNGKIYVFGGFKSGPGSTDRIVEFDPETRTAVILEATLPMILREASAATASNGKIYLFGGRSANGQVNSVIEFDPVTQTARQVTGLPIQAYSTSAATAPNGKIYVFGGWTGGSPGARDTVIEFDPEANQAKTLKVVLPSGRDSTSAATAPNGEIYVFGGYDANYDRLDDIIEFDVSVPAVWEYRKIITADASGAVTVDGEVTASSFNATT